MNYLSCALAVIAICIPQTLQAQHLYIQTKNNQPIDSKDIHVEATLQIDNTPQLHPLEIRGRGNSTWLLEKKPYKLKLKEKTSLLGLPADKEWTLLANHSDKTLIRNVLALEFGKQIGLPFTPKAKPIELTVNGEYLGAYVLAEQIAIAPDRINITKLKKTDIQFPEISGGYLIELDERMDADVAWRTRRGIPYTIKEPKLVPEQIAYIQNYIQDVEDKLYSENFKDEKKGYVTDINVPSFIDWYIVNELFKNQDSGSFSSIYFYKDRNQKLAMGPIWDFDLALGNVDYSDANKPEGWWVKDQSIWFKRLFEDPKFEAKVKARWSKLRKTVIAKLPSRLEELGYSMSELQTRNFSRWPVLDKYVWPNAVITGSYEGEIEYAKRFLEERTKWLDWQFGFKAPPSISP